MHRKSTGYAPQVMLPLIGVFVQRGQDSSDLTYNKTSPFQRLPRLTEALSLGENAVCPIAC
jgi:hypothetical protein